MPDLLLEMQTVLIQWASHWSGGGVAWIVVPALLLASGVVVVPRPAICIAAGLAFGLGVGFPLALAGATAGALLGFSLSRYLFRERFIRFAGRHPRMRLIVDAVDAEGWRLVFLIRIASPIPSTVTNYAFGLSGISARNYVLATFFGITAPVFAFVYLGSLGKTALDDRSVSNTQLMFGAAGVVLLLIVFAMVARRVRAITDKRLALPATQSSRAE